MTIYLITCSELRSKAAEITRALRSGDSFLSPRRPFNPGRPGQPCPAFAYITDCGKVLESAHFGIALLAFGID